METHNVRVREVSTCLEVTCLETRGLPTDKTFQAGHSIAHNTVHVSVLMCWCACLLEAIVNYVNCGQ